MAKQTIKKIGDVERAIELARNNRSNSNPYGINDTTQNINGTAIDKSERNAQLARNDFSKNKPYDVNSID